ncbi:secreted protein [Niveomyces insectorum RCEF 264]|uniref:Secreted protein n=1 Tax=Niveomyces insectorum RCEF 264 TaxID=1081102 RepID=A0A167XU08_9HYPO|nr:secreted protein [Niveomyces insectorum RCEF 264]
MQPVITSALALGLLVGSVAAVPMPMPTPPGIPSSSAAKALLAGLTVSPSTDDGGYARDLFKTWDTIEGTCNTREYVLKRDGTGVVTNSACTATSGTWVSPYDGATWTAASDLDIDHMVPLKNAWMSGANAWTAAKREQFANDVTRPQLWSVTDNVNESKGDRSPDQWKPPLSSFYCTYARSWVEVKSYWSLTITSAEKAALTSMLNMC